jgi:hypothetical protein
LAALRMESFAMVRVYAGLSELKVRTEALEQVRTAARPVIDFEQPELLLERSKAALHRIEMGLASLRPAGPVTLGQARAEDYQYFALRERAGDLARHIRWLEDRFETARRAQRRPSYRRPDAARRHPYKVIHGHGSSWIRPLLREMAAALDINEFLHEVAAQASEAATGPYVEELWHLVRQTALLQAMADGARKPDVDHFVLLPRGLTSGLAGTAWDLLMYYKGALRELDLEAEFGPTPIPRMHEYFYLRVAGPHARSVLEGEAGMHLFCPQHAPIKPIQVIVLPVGSEADPKAIVSGWMKQREEWLMELARGNAGVEEDPLPCGPVVRIYHESEQIIDLAPGLVLPEKDLLSCLYAALPVPAEIHATDDFKGRR